MLTTTARSAELCLRTGPGRFRKVMWYGYGAQYGNDIGRNRAENTLNFSWMEVFVVEFHEFWGSLFKGQGSDLPSKRERARWRNWQREQPRESNAIGPAIN